MFKTLKASSFETKLFINFQELKSKAMDTLCALVFQLGRRFQLFLPIVTKVLNKHRISHQRYDVLITKILRGSTVAEEEDDSMMMIRRRTRRKRSEQRHQQPLGDSQLTNKRPPVSLRDLQKAWHSCPRRISKEDWNEWLKIFAVDLIHESRVLSIRSCFPLAQAYTSVARDLFNPAFLSCWTELSDEDQHVIDLVY